LSKTRGRVVDILALIGCALLIIALGMASFFAADVYHVGLTWVVYGWLSIGFFANVGWDYRREFKSIAFVFFFGAWLCLHSLMFAFVRGYLNWYWYIPLLLLELFVFYASASLLFGLDPPVGR
jgi:hypothetical protein